MSDNEFNIGNIDASRRTVLKAAAWAAPVVAIAAAAPLAAASDPTPGPLPPGLEYEWGGTVQVTIAGDTRYINRFNGNTVWYNVYTEEGPVPSGTYTTDVWVDVTWDTEASITPTVTNYNGWVVASGSLDPSSTGTVRFVPSATLTNGLENAIILPQLTFVATAGGTFPTGSIITGLSGTNLGTVYGGIGA